MSEPSAQELDPSPSVNVVGICHDCARRFSFFTCEAYPVQIPWDILTGERDHRVAQPGDNGLHFLPANIFPYDPEAVSKSLVSVAGLAVQAMDTGRVLLIQRADAPGDPAALRWEFPGGHLENDETPLAGAIREWQEETGATLPNGGVIGSWVNGVYQGFAWAIESEDDVTFESGEVINPDDPDGDEFEALAWFDPELLPDLPSLRDEARTTDWSVFA